MHREATRIIQAIDGRIEGNTKSGARIEVTYGQVHDIVGDVASVYIVGTRELATTAGETPEPSTDFRIPTHLVVAEGDHVRVSMDDRGDRWVDEVFATQPSGGVPTALDTLSDVDTTGKADGEVLTYDSTSGNWLSEPLPAPPTSVLEIDDLTDVDTTTITPSGGQAMVWDDSTDQWVPGAWVGTGGSGGGGTPDQTVTTYIPPLEPMPAYIAPPTLGSVPGYLTEHEQALWPNRYHKRVSNIAGQRNAYPRVAGTNSDDTLMLHGQTTGPSTLVDANTGAHIRTLNILPGTGQWSNVNPNKIWGAWSEENRLISVNANVQANTITTHRTFTGYTSISLGDGEGGFSDDDKTVVLMTVNSGGENGMLVYDTELDTIVATHNFGASRPDTCFVSRGGNYVLVYWSVQPNPDGPGAQQGLWQYDRNLNLIRQLTQYARHGDVCRLANGTEAWAQVAFGGEVYNLETGALTQLFAEGRPYPYNNAFSLGHISGRATARNGYIYASTYNYPGAGTMQGKDLIMSMPLDGSQNVEIWGWSNHRNDGQSTTFNYYSCPFAVPNRAGTRVYYGSTYGSTTVQAYAYQIRYEKTIIIPGTPGTDPSGGVSEIRIGSAEPNVAAYRTEVLDDSPLGYYRLGEPSGSLMLDDSPNERHGTYAGGPLLGAAGAVVNDTAMNTNATGYGVVPDNSVFDFTTGPFTIELFAKREGTVGTLGDGIIGKGSGGVLMMMDTAGILELSKRDEGALVKSSIALPNDAAWHHIVAQYQQGSTAKMWIDGIDRSTAVNTTRTLVANSSDLVFAGIAEGDRVFHGHLDEIAFYSSILSSGRIAAHYTARVNPEVGPWQEKIRLTDQIQFSAFGTERDTNLYRSSANVLKTDDAFQAASLAIGTNRVARFVQLVPYSEPISAGTYTSSDGSAQTIELTGVPSSGVVAVQVQVIARSTTANASNSVSVIPYSGSALTEAAVCYAGAVAGFNQSITATVATGGTNSRQIKYWRSFGAGTVTWFLRVLGYWTTA
jgi:hypothetical protein